MFVGRVRRTEKIRSFAVIPTFVNQGHPFGVLFHPGGREPRPLAWADIGPPRSGFWNAGRRFGMSFVSQKRLESLMFEPTNRLISFIGLFRRNATALCQPRPTAWVVAIHVTANPKGVTLIGHYVCWPRSSDGKKSFICGDSNLRESGPPLWGFISTGGTRTQAVGLG